MPTEEHFRHRVELAQGNRCALQIAELEGGTGAQTADLEPRDSVFVLSYRSWCLVLLWSTLSCACPLPFGLGVFTLCCWILEVCDLLLYFTEAHS